MLNLQSHIEGAVQLWKERLSCSAPSCRGRKPWAHITDGSGSVRLHGHRYCFPVCFKQELQRRLNELQLRPSEKPRPPHRVPLGLMLLSRGQLEHDQLRRALDAQKQSGGRIGEWLQQLGFVREHQITSALGFQWSCPVLRSLPPPTADCALPRHLLHRFRMVPVHFNKSTRVLHVAFAADIEYRALLAIEQMLDCKAEPCLADGSAVESWLQSSQEQACGTDPVFESVRGPDETARILVSYATKFCADDARITTCGEYIWARIQGGDDAADLFFRRSSAPPK